MMRVLITGTSSGIGRATALKFLDMGDMVLGLDWEKPTISHERYTHYICDVSKKDDLPNVGEVNILVNNAGVQLHEREIEINLMGTYYVTEKYGIQPNIKAIVMVASSSAHTGAEFPLYAASKGGMLAYTKNVALRVAQYKATCNSISPGGVTTDLNKHILEDEKLWNEVMNETLIPKWASPEEIADWIYFVAAVNKSMTAQDILIDNGEAAKANFVW